MPAEVFPPSDYIEDAMSGMSRQELAQRVGVHSRVVDELLDNGRPLTRDLAHRLGVAFDTSPDLWMNLQKAWRDGLD